MEINEQTLLTIVNVVLRVANILKNNIENLGFEEIKNELGKRLERNGIDNIEEAQKILLEMMKRIAPEPGSMNIELNLLCVTYEFVEFYGEARDDGFGIFYPPRRVIVDS